MTGFLTSEQELLLENRELRNRIKQLEQQIKDPNNCRIVSEAFANLEKQDKRIKQLKEEADRIRASRRRIDKERNEFKAENQRLTDGWKRCFFAYGLEVMKESSDETEINWQQALKGE